MCTGTASARGGGGQSVGGRGGVVPRWPPLFSRRAYCSKSERVGATVRRHTLFQRPVRATIAGTRMHEHHHPKRDPFAPHHPDIPRHLVGEGLGG